MTRLATVINKIIDIINTKQPTLVSGENIKKLNGTDIVGSGNIPVKTVGGESILGDGNVGVKTINGETMIGSGDAEIVGTGTLSTTAQNIIGAINELDTDKAEQSDLTALTGRVGTAETDIVALDGRVTQAEAAVGTPLVASTVAGMTDNTKIYVYTGSETGYTSGNWYYWNGTAWTSGGVYNSTAFQTDTTLAVSGMAADAKVVGDELTDVKSDIKNGFLSYVPVEQGSFASTGKDGSASNRIRTDYIYFNAGDKIEIKSPTLRYGVGMWTLPISSANCVRNDGNWQTVGELIEPNFNGCLIIVFSKTDNSDLTPSDFVGSIRNYNSQIWENESLLNAIVGNITPTNANNFYEIGINNNLVGMIPNRKYPAFVKMSNSITISTSDGSVFDSNSTLRIRFLRQDGVEIDYFLLNNGESSRTVRTYSGDAYYLTFSEAPSVPLMVNYGVTALPYEPYLDNLKYITDTLNDYVISNNNKSVLSLNLGVEEKIRQAKKCLSSEIQPLILAHISDLHLDGTRLKRYVDFVNSVNDIDDAICTGDMVDSFANSYSFWGDNGAGGVLTVMGNHDGLADTSAGWYEGQASMSDVYNKYMSPHISGWNANHAGTNTYYYKDYSAKKIRLVVIDSMRSGADATMQNTWLASVLADAKANGYYVVVATHCVPETNDGIDYVDCTFTSKKFTYEDLYDGCITFDTYQQTVQAFIDSGGNFICWMCGHTHVDFVYTTEEYPDQLWVVVTCGKQSVNNDQDRTIGTKAEDAFNILSFDINNNIVKVIRVGADRDCFMRYIGALSIDYTTHQIIFND